LDRITSRRRSPALTLLIAFLLLGALLLRLWSINKESFWADEGWTMLLSHGPSLSQVVQTVADDQHPPLYFALFHYWNLLTGSTEFAARLFSAFWSVIGVALIYRLGADVFSRQTGLLAALILALADNDIMLAQETRQYTQMAALAVLSTIFYLRYIRHANRANGIGWLLSSIALMYTHYLGAFILLTQLLHILLIVRPFRRWPDLVVRWTLIGVAWLPWLFVFIEQSLIRYTRAVFFQSGIPNSPQTFIALRTDLFGAHFGLMVGLLLFGLIYVSYRAGVPAVRLRPFAPTIYVLLWVVLPIAIIIAINSRREILTLRNFLLITPAIALLIGHGLSNIERTARTLLVIVIVGFSLTTLDSYFIKPPWRQVSQDIMRYRLSDEPIIMDVWVDDFALRYYVGRVLNAYPAALPLISVHEWFDTYKDQFFVRLTDYLKGKPSVWLADWSNDQDGVLRLLTDQGFVQTALQTETHLETNVIRVYRFDRQPTAPPIVKFADKLALLKVSYPQTVQRGDTLPVSLWWSVLNDPARDYSVSAFLLNASGQLVAQHDGSPLDGKSPMSGWHAGDLRFDQPHIAIPADMPAGTYTLGLKVYWYADPKPLAFTGMNGDYPILGTLIVQ